MLSVSAVPEVAVPTCTDDRGLPALTIACVQAGFGDGGLGPGEEDTLARLDQLPAPFPDLATFLRQLAVSYVPPIPAGRPADLGKWLEGVAQTIRETSS
jgi:hypothetical protein